MPHAATSVFFDGLHASELLDEARINELKARPEAAWGDVISLAAYAQERGWLTPYQVQELREGRGNQLAVAGYRIFEQDENSPGDKVYRALHPALTHPVSLKIVHKDWLSPSDTLDDFVSRLQSAALVQSPFLVSILDAGLLDDSAFVVHEFVDGCDLYHLVNEMGALPVGLACEYIREAAVALQAAHDKGVVHGNVSPLTLLLSPIKRAASSNGDISTRPRPGARAKLMGLSLTPLRPAVNEMTVGQSDRLGPVAFLPPERLTTSERTSTGDMYGLGASLYYLLTTRPPHAGETELEALLSVRQGEPAPLESLRSDVPPAVIDLVRRLLNREPTVRPAAAEVIETLRPYCETIPEPEEPAVGDAVMLATETCTQPGVPTAVPVSPTDPNQHALPHVEPLPEFHPLEDSGRHGTFSPSTFGVDGAKPARARAQVTRKNAVWVVAGLCLHLTAVLLLAGYLTNWFAFLRVPATPDNNQVEEKKESPIKKGKGKTVEDRTLP